MKSEKIALLCLVLSCIPLCSCALLKSTKRSYKTLPSGKLVDKTDLQEAKKKVEALFRFEYACKSELSFNVLDLRWNSPRLIGVIGCGQRVVYVNFNVRVEGGEWYRNTERAKKYAGLQKMRHLRRRMNALRARKNAEIQALKERLETQSSQNDRRHRH
ncbi:MAG: hypothetical protein CL920_07705 [Deltaproteobacteria bacterium]|nr:hypothetical protein [Deltaproteobacteria bacterium]MBU48564.1 hypothetical protein [Deltaproteobacteria bacterium]